MAPDKVLDAKGLMCPMPIMKTSQAVRELPVDGVLEILATDPASKPDMEAWCKMTGNELLSASEEPGTPKVYRFTVRKKK